MVNADGFEKLADMIPERIAALNTPIQDAAQDASDEYFARTLNGESVDRYELSRIIRHHGRSPVPVEARRLADSMQRLIDDSASPLRLVTLNLDEARLCAAALRQHAPAVPRDQTLDELAAKVEDAANAIATIAGRLINQEEAPPARMDAIIRHTTALFDQAAAIRSHVAEPREPDAPLVDIHAMATELVAAIPATRIAYPEGHHRLLGRFKAILALSLHAAVASTGETPEAPRGPVHNHGVEEGPGLSCRESVINGRRVGACLRASVQEPTAETPEAECTCYARTGSHGGSHAMSCPVFREYAGSQS